MRPLLAVAVGLLLLAAACSPEDVQQEAAREGVERHVAALPGYEGEVHCTDAAKGGYLVEIETEVFVCAARRSDGDCDWFRATLRGGRVEQVRLEARRAGCVLPG